MGGYESARNEHEREKDRDRNDELLRQVVRYSSIDSIINIAYGKSRSRADALGEKSELTVPPTVASRSKDGSGAGSSSLMKSACAG